MPDCRTTPLAAIGVAALLFLSLAILAAAPAGAKILEPVPLPYLRPENAPTPAATTTPVPSADDSEVAQQKPGLFPFFKKQTPKADLSRFTPQQQDILENISAYFNSFKTMEGAFIQFGPHGEQSEGQFYIARPGKIRFRYSPPVKLDVISDGINVVIRDSKANTQDVYPLSKTPLRYLLANDIDLASVVTDVSEQPDLFSVLIVEKSQLVKGKLTLIFDKKTYQLKQWIVTDAQGLNTAVDIYNVTTGKKQDPGLYAIKYDKNP